MRWTVLLLTATALAAQTDPGRIRRATEFARAGKWPEAETTLKGVEPPNAPGERIAFYRLRAEIASALGHNAAAASEMRAALALAPSKADLLLATATAERRAGENQNAVEHLLALPKSPPNWTLIGELQNTIGDRDAALKSFAEAANLAANEEAYRLRYAYELARDEKFEAARTILTDMRSPQGRTLLALIDYATGKDDEAAKALLEASDLELDWAVPVEILGELELRRDGAPDSSAVDRVCLWADRTKEPHGQALCAALVLAAARSQSSKEAGDDILERLTEAAKAAPDDATAQCALAQASEWLNRKEAAAGSAERCALLRPKQEDRSALARRLIKEFAGK
jgi:predicted Zn-dependent protease